LQFYIFNINLRFSRGFVAKPLENFDLMIKEKTMNYYYPPHIQLHKTKPKGFSLFMIIGWSISLFFLAFYPSIIDKILWIPSVKWFSIPGPLFLPFSWGWSKDYNIVGLIVSSIVMWFLGNSLQLKLGKKRMFGYFFMTLGTSFVVFSGLSLISNTGIGTLAPHISVVTAWGIFKTHGEKVLVYKDRLVGNTKYIPYLIYGFTGFGFLMALIKGKPTATYISIAASLVAASFFFNRKLFNTVLNKVSPGKKQPKLWAMRGGKWGKN
jgi:hypothetical protein